MLKLGCISGFGWFADIDFEKMYIQMSDVQPLFLRIQPCFPSRFFFLVSVVDVQSPHPLGKVVGKIRFDG